MDALPDEEQRFFVPWAFCHCNNQDREKELVETLEAIRFSTPCDLKLGGLQVIGCYIMSTRAQFTVYTSFPGLSRRRGSDTESNGLNLLRMLTS